MKWLNYWNASTIGRRLCQLGVVGFFVFCFYFSVFAQSFTSPVPMVEVNLIKTQEISPDKLPMTLDEAKQQIMQLKRQVQLQQTQIESKDKLLDEWVTRWTMLKTPEKVLLDKLTVLTTSRDELKKASDKAEENHQAETDAFNIALDKKDQVIRDLTIERDNFKTLFRQAKEDQIKIGIFSGLGGGGLGFVLGRVSK